MVKYLLFLVIGVAVVCVIYAFWESFLIIALLALIAGVIYKRHKKNSKKEPTEHSKTAERKLSEETFQAVGVNYYEKNIHKLATTNADWKLSAKKIIADGKIGKRIYKNYYVNKPVKLQIEPTNPNDKNAVAVIIAGELVGYISREDNIHVKDILKHREIISVSGFIGGGEYKIINDDGSVIKAEHGFNVKVRIKYI